MKHKTSIEDIKSLTNWPSDLLPIVERVYNGLVEKAGMEEKAVITLFVKMLMDVEKHARTRNRLTNLAKKVYELNKEGIQLGLPDDAKKWTPEEKCMILESKPSSSPESFALLEKGIDYKVYGKSHIEQGAFNQMNIASRLPIAVAGSLMPDAHQGYGLPIGGVLATKADKIIPYAVGVDIACRMCLSVFDVGDEYVKRESDFLKKALVKNTNFGVGGEIRDKLDTSVMDKEEWTATKTIRDLKDKAFRQLGTSGTGNHFVEWGTIKVSEVDDTLNLPVGNYLALLSHSGSRGFGGAIAGHYSKIAKQKTILPEEAAHLAWLDMNKEEGQEYWIAMNLAGDYASACHHEIHDKIAREICKAPIAIVENHHNFAWKETFDNEEVLVHRKGATPAGKNVLGIIPGSMATPGFVVKGLGVESSVYSASHGAGRLMSRSAAFKSIEKSEVARILQENNIELIGGDLDEAPMAYKDINQVINAQKDLVKILAEFTPKIVRMADPKGSKRKRS